MPCGWAVQTKDLALDRQRLQAAGVTVSEPVRAGRRRPDGVRLDWETANEESTKLSQASRRPNSSRKTKTLPRRVRRAGWPQPDRTGVALCASLKPQAGGLGRAEQPLEDAEDALGQTHLVEAPGRIEIGPSFPTDDRHSVDAEGWPLEVTSGTADGVCHQVQWV